MQNVIGGIVQSNLLYNRFILQGTIKQQILNFRTKNSHTQKNKNKQTNKQSIKQKQQLCMRTVTAIDEGKVCMNLVACCRIIREVYRTTFFFI